MQLGLLSRRALLLGLAVLLASLSMSYRSSHVGPDDFIDAWRVETAIDPHGWRRLDSGDWLQLAKAATQAGQSEQAVAYLKNLLAHDPTHGEALARLANLLHAQGKLAEAEQLAALATRLAPAHDDTQLQLAVFWSNTSNAAQRLQAWHVLLTRIPTMRQGFYPHLRLALDDPQTRPLFDEFAKNPPLWWTGFFNYLANSADVSLDTLAHLHRLRQQAGTIPVNEVSVYLGRLIKENQWEQAHAVWLASLPPEAQSLAKTLYDGGFEGEIHNTGFDWFFHPTKQVSIKPDITFGMDGNKALSIQFNGGQHMNFQHVEQRLVLQPSAYRLSLRYRTDNFRTTKGLQWRLRCQTDQRLLGESPPILESHKWAAMELDFVVPANNCTAQLLRLEAASSYAHEQIFSGKVWFDTLQIQQKAN